MIAHLPLCLATMPGAGCACNCGADPLAGLPAEERARIERTADKAEETQRRISRGVYQVDYAAEGRAARAATVARETAAYHARQADPLAGIPDAERVAIQAGAERARRETGMRTTAPWCGQAAYDGFVKLAADAYRARQATPPPGTPLRAVARMLLRMRDRASHHDDAKHLLTTAYAAAELAAPLSPAEAIRVLDGVEPALAAPTPAGCPFCSVPHDPGDCCQA